MISKRVEETENRGWIDLLVCGGAARQWPGHGQPGYAARAIGPRLAPPPAGEAADSRGQ